VKIAVIGCGFVGGATLRWFQETNQDVVAHDPPKGLVADLARADTFFVCVPTPYVAAGHDTSIVESVAAEIPGNKTVVIKSTVLPGTTDALQKQFPQHRVLFCPEFLRERHAYDDFAHPDRQVVGITSTDQLPEARKLLSILPIAARTSIVHARVAEMTKYFSNCYLSMRVTFANQMADLCGAASTSAPTATAAMAGRASRRTCARSSSSAGASARRCPSSRRARLTTTSCSTSRASTSGS
jgi:nucleotide sugar dehydrogenase